MLIGVFAAPTSFSDYIIYLIGCLLDRKYGAFIKIFANTLDELRSGWEHREGRAVLLTTDMPDVDLLRFLLDAKVPMVGVFDEPLHTFLARYPEMNFNDAVRITTAHLSTLSPAFHLESLIKVDTRFLRSPVRGFVEALSGDVFGETDPELVEAVSSMLAPEGPDTSVQALVDLRSGSKRDVEACLRSLTQDQRATVTTLAESYGEILQGGVLRRVEWPLGLFELGTRGYNLIGGGRRIVWGPQLCLPRGTWRATVRVETAENFSGNEIGAEVWSPPGTKVIEGHLSLPERGIFRFWLDFDIEDTTRGIETIIFLRKGAIEGKFKMIDMTVERIEVENKSALLTSSMV